MGVFAGPGPLSASNSPTTYRPPVPKKDSGQNQKNIRTSVDQSKKVRARFKNATLIDHVRRVLAAPDAASYLCTAFGLTLIYGLLVGFKIAVRDLRAYIKEGPVADAEAEDSAANESDTGSFESAQLWQYDALEFVWNNNIEFPMTEEHFS